MNVVLSAFLIWISYGWIKNNIVFTNHFQTVAASYWLMTFGYYIKKTYLPIDLRKNVCVLCLFLPILLYCDKICNANGWNSNVNLFDNPFMYIVSSLSGFFVVMSASSIIANVKNTEIIEMIGKHTLAVMIFHFLAFKIVILIQIWIYKEPMYRLASFPGFDTSQFWWLVYGIVGVCVPLVLVFIKDVILKESKKRIKSPY